MNTEKQSVGPRPFTTEEIDEIFDDHRAQPDAKYIGEGVNVSFDGSHVWLQTSDGYQVTNEITMGPEVWHQLTLYVAWLREENERKAAEKARVPDGQA